MDTFNPNQMPPINSEPVKKSTGPLVAVLIILALIIIGGLYFLKTRSANENYQVPAQTANDTDPTAALKQQGSSDDLGSIESDLRATNLNNLDQGAAALEAEIQ